MVQKNLSRRKKKRWWKETEEKYAEIKGELVGV